MTLILVFILKIEAEKLNFECLDGSTETLCKVNRAASGSI